jgi:ATP-dependent 26S proteasome regulatory subunit
MFKMSSVMEVNSNKEAKKMPKEETLLPLLYAGFDVIYLRTTEQERAYEDVIQELKNSSEFSEMNVYVWKANCNLVKRSLPGVAVPTPSEIQRGKVAEGFLPALNYILAPEGVLEENEPGITDYERRRRQEANRRRREASESVVEAPRSNSIYFMFNPKPHLNTKSGNLTVAYAIIQTIRDIAIQLKAVGSFLVFLGDDLELPSELSDIVTFVEFALPTREELKPFFSDFISKNFPTLTHPVTEDLLEQAADSMVGIPMSKAENAIALSISTHGGIDLEILQSEKQQIIKQSGVLSWIRLTETMNTIGGFDLAKEHVRKRAKYFSSIVKARSFGLTPPKGIMVVGPGGTGKTLFSQCIAWEMRLRLYKMDMGAVFGGIVGASEQNIRTALKMIEALAPCAVVFDEFEKSIAGLESSGKSDSGVTSRVIATLLSWMQDCKLPIYKIATCNSIRNLDGPLFRKGRWDEVFGVDLPTDEEREEIFKIHLRKRHRDPDAFDLRELANATTEWVGAEIEATIEEALFEAFDKEVELTTDLILAAAKDVVPLSVTDKEGMDTFRSWVRVSARPASSARRTPAALTKAPAVAGGTSSLRRVLQKN